MTQEQFRNYQEQSFEAFCKKVIRNEAINIHKRLTSLSEKEVSLSSLSHSGLSAFCYEDTYHIYQKTYYVRGTPIRVYDPDLGEVLQFLSPQRRDVIFYVSFWIIATEILPDSCESAVLRSALARLLPSKN